MIWLSSRQNESGFTNTAGVFEEVQLSPARVYFPGTGLKFLRISCSTFDTVRTVCDRNRIQFAELLGSLKPFLGIII